MASALSTFYNGMVLQPERKMLTVASEALPQSALNILAKPGGSKKFALMRGTSGLGFATALTAANPKPCRSQVSAWLERPALFKARSLAKVGER